MDNVKEIVHCINIIQNIAAICGDRDDQLYVMIEAFNQQAKKIGRNEQEIMNSCRAAVACLIGSLVPHEYFDSFMEDIGLLEDDIYNNTLFEVQEDSQE